MSASLSAFLYLVASVCFILALRGLSSPVTSRSGNMFGIAGMVIAIGTTLASPGIVSYPLIVAGIVIGGAIGTFIALRIQMTALPQLVAAFHSLVGFAAVCVAAAAFYAPASYGIGEPGAIRVESLIEMAIGTAHRRHHLHRLDHRVRQAARAYHRQAAGVPGAASAQRDTGHRAGRDRRVVLHRVSRRSRSG